MESFVELPKHAIVVDVHPQKMVVPSCKLVYKATNKPCFYQLLTLTNLDTYVALPCRVSSFEHPIGL